MNAPVMQAAAPVKLPMTAPVTQAPAAGGFIVPFVLPRSVTPASAPQPLDEPVERLRHRKPLTVVRRTVFTSREPEALQGRPRKGDAGP